MSNKGAKQNGNLSSTIDDESEESCLAKNIYVSKGLAIVYLTFYFAILVTVALLVSHFSSNKYEDKVIFVERPCSELIRSTTPTTTTTTTTTTTSTTTTSTSTTASTSLTPITSSTSSRTSLTSLSTTSTTTTTTKSQTTTEDPNLLSECAKYSTNFPANYRPDKYELSLYGFNLSRQSFTLSENIYFKLLKSSNYIDVHFNSDMVEKLAIGLSKLKNNARIRIVEIVSHK